MRCLMLCVFLTALQSTAQAGVTSTSTVNIASVSGQNNYVLGVAELTVAGDKDWACSGATNVPSPPFRMATLILTFQDGFGVSEVKADGLIDERGCFLAYGRHSASLFFEIEYCTKRDVFQNPATRLYGKRVHGVLRYYREDPQRNLKAQHSGDPIILIHPHESRDDSSF